MKVVKLLPILVAFFALGSIDMVGIGSNYVKADFGLTDSLASLIPTLLFFWFLFFSVPTGILMHRVGRKNTVLLSFIVILLAMIVPLIYYSFGTALLAFSLLGIGNNIMLVSINPLVSDVVDEKYLPSTLTFGQFVKAISSFSAPLLAAWGAVYFKDSFNSMGWKVLFPIYAIITVVAFVWVYLTKIDEDKSNGNSPSFKQTYALLGDGMVFMLFLGIICNVGIDVGLNITAPKIMIERLGLSLEQAGFATSFYFIFRIIGCLLGAYFMMKLTIKSFYWINILILTASVITLFFASDIFYIYLALGLAGLSNANFYSMILYEAMKYRPDKKNEVSALLNIGLFGGAIFPFFMGVASDGFGTQAGAIAILLLGCIYKLFLGTRLKKVN